MWNTDTLKPRVPPLATKMRESSQKHLRQPPTGNFTIGENPGFHHAGRNTEHRTLQPKAGKTQGAPV